MHCKEAERSPEIYYNISLAVLSSTSYARTGGPPGLSKCFSWDALGLFLPALVSSFNVRVPWRWYGELIYMLSLYLAIVRPNSPVSFMLLVVSAI